VTVSGRVPRHLRLSREALALVRQVVGPAPNPRARKPRPGEGLPPGFPFPCDDELVGQRVAGEDYAGTVIGCAVPPPGGRGRHLYVGGNAVARSRVVSGQKRSARTRAELAARWSGPDFRPGPPRIEEQPAPWFPRPRQPELAAPWFAAPRAQELAAPWFEVPGRDDDTDLVIEHSAEEGTTIHGDTRRWAQAIKGLHGGWKWWRQGQRWYRQQSIGRVEPSVPLEVWARRLREAGATVRVVEPMAASKAEADAIRRQVLEDRAARLGERAERAAEESAALWRRGDGMAEAIPLGQPILVGHHSEQRDRRYRERIHGVFTKAAEAGRKAGYLEQRAVSAARRAAQLAPEVQQRIGERNEFGEALAGLISTRLKRDTGAASITKRAKGTGQHGWHLYEVRYPAAANMGWWSVDVWPTLVNVHPYASGATMQIPYGGRVPEEVYQAIVEAVPHAPAIDAAAMSPSAWANAVVEYAGKRITRATGATSTEARGAFLMAPARLSMRWAGRGSMTIEVGHAAQGSQGEDFIASVEQRMGGAPSTWALDLHGMTVQQAYEAIVSAIKERLR
jgi:hypothetical protein